MHVVVAGAVGQPEAPGVAAVPCDRPGRLTELLEAPGALLVLRQQVLDLQLLEDPPVGDKRRASREDRPEVLLALDGHLLDEQRVEVVQILGRHVAVDRLEHAQEGVLPEVARRLVKDVRAARSGRGRRVQLRAQVVESQHLALDRDVGVFLVEPFDQPVGEVGWLGGLGVLLTGHPGELLHPPEADRRLPRQSGDALAGGRRRDG